MTILKLTDASKGGEGEPMRMNVERWLWYQPQEHDDDVRSMTTPSVRARVHFDSGAGPMAALVQQTARQIDDLLAAIEEQPLFLKLTDASTGGKGGRLRVNTSRMLRMEPYAHVFGDESDASVQSRMQIDAGIGQPASMFFEQTIDEIDEQLGIGNAIVIMLHPDNVSGIRDAEAAHPEEETS